ncbi:MAG: histidine kinase [Candidatus Scalindua sp.]|nr:histidine kinase [Candidatus Scalindua sp.]MCR4344186.1 histidine kinase [Candidatus Scalindua sp.]
MTLKVKSLLWFLLPSILIATSTATFCYFTTYKTVKKNIFDQLEIAADELHKHVCIFLDGKRGRIIDSSSDGFIRDCTEKITRKGDSSQQCTDKLNAHLTVNKQPLDPDILVIFVADLDGRVISSTEVDQIGRDVSDETYFAETMKRGFCISDIKYSSEFEQSIFFDVARLLLTNDGLHIVGIIVNRYSCKSFRNITHSGIIWEFGQEKQLEGLGSTGEVYIVNRDKLMITESRFNNDVILKQVVDTEGVRAAFDNEVGMIGIYTDYRGHLILGVSRYVEEMDWVILAEKDISEAFAPLASLQRFAFIMGVVGVMAILTVAFFFAKMITRPITSLALAAGDIANGDLNGIMGIKSKDEIGNLADSFNRMTASLRKFRDDLTESEERYRDLIENSSEIIYRMDKKRFFVDMNKTMLDKLGFLPEELMGMRIDNIVPANEHVKVINHIRRVIGKGSDSIETMFISRKAEIVYVEINANASYDADGNFIETRAFARDITERMKAAAAEKHGRELRLLNSHTISIQEKERRRISRELHDDAGQALTAMKINVEMMEKEIPDSAASVRKRLADTKQLLAHTLQEIRTLAFDLRPSLLDHFGVQAAIREYSKNYSERTNIAVQVSGKNIVERFLPEIDILLYRCAQEALNNVVKHSKATNVKIEIIQEEREIHMKVKDNGNGFDVKEAFEENRNGKSIGLFGMKERIALLNGSLRIHSEKNKGSELEILVPFKTNKKNNLFEAGRVV